MAAKKRPLAGNSTGFGNASFMGWLGAVAIALFFLIYPYERGMFNGYEPGFESIINRGLIYAFVLLTLFAVFLFRNWRLNSHVAILSIAVFLLPLIYWLSSLNAVSGYYAGYMTLVYGAYAGLLLVSLYAARATATRAVIEGGIMLAGAMIVLFGLFNLFGQTYKQDALWLAHDGYRLTSVFQYSNTYAGFLIALFLAAAYYAAHSARTSVRLAAAAMLAPVWLSFMLTYSRGAIVIIPVIVLLVLPFLRLSKQIAYLLYMMVSIVAVMLVLGKVSANTASIAEIVQPTAEKAPSTISMFTSLPLQSWGLLLLTMTISAGVVWFYHAKLEKWVERKLEKWSNRKLSIVIVPAAIVILGTVAAALLLGSPAIRGLLPDQLADRLANINFQQHSVLERFTFYKDGLNVANDYPLLGAGGGAWQAVYEQYQNNPYVSRQAHSFFVQVLVETGWIGLLAMIGIMAYIYFLYIRSHIRHPEKRGSHLVFYIISLSLLVHSAIDFDMSYIYIAALVFVSLGCMAAAFGDKLTISRLDAMGSKPWKNMIFPGIVGLVAVAMLFVTIQNNRAILIYNETLEKAYRQQASFQELMDSMDKAISIAPKQSAYAVTKADWLLQAYDQNKEDIMLLMASSTIAKAEEHNSYSRELFNYKIKLFQTTGQMDNLLLTVNETLIKYPWDITFYETAMNSYNQARVTAIASQDGTKAEEYATKIREIGTEVQRRVDLLATLPPEQQQGRNFALTETMNAILMSLH